MAKTKNELLKQLSLKMCLYVKQHLGEWERIQISQEGQKFCLQPFINLI